MLLKPVILGSLIFSISALIRSQRGLGSKCGEGASGANRGEPETEKNSNSLEKYQRECVGCVYVCVHSSPVRRLSIPTAKYRREVIDSVFEGLEKSEGVVGARVRETPKAPS